MQVVLLTTHENITGNGLRPTQKIIRRRKNEKKPSKMEIGMCLKKIKNTKRE